MMQSASHPSASFSSAIDSAAVKAQALNLGFHKVGIAAVPVTDAPSEALHSWLAQGYHADLTWMESPRRRDIRQVMPEVRSIICVALNYYTPHQRPEGEEYAKISRYGWGRDYHRVLQKRLKALATWLGQQGEDIQARYYADTGPIQDKVWAERAGIGWIAKNSNLITREYGSWVFLGEVLTNLVLTADRPHLPHCGTCTRCLEACPTGAITQPFVVDANRCIAYHTIENRAEQLPDAIAPHLQGWVAGCDICQDVCPWNQRFAQETDLEDFQPYPWNIAPKLTELAALTDEECDRRFPASALRRIKPEMLRRNARASIVLAASSFTPTFYPSMSMNLETLAVHAGRMIDPATGAVVPPLHLSTTFERSPDGSQTHGYSYIRDGNPNRRALEECLCALEGGAVAAAFASGSAATMSVFQALAPGDHVLAPLDAYAGTAKLLRSVLMPWGLEVTFVDMTNLAQVKEALSLNTRLIWVETPSNPLLKVTDIGKIAELAHQINALCVCDNTWATPVLQQPFQQGADLVVHATTKYLGGHSDLQGGITIAHTDSGFFQRIRQIQILGGAIAAPFDCWLALRGIQTLPYRMQAHCHNARQVAEFLNQHPAIEAVHYPGLSQHPGHAIAAQQMRDFGGMLSMQVKGGRETAFAMAAKVQVFTYATSLGGTESLIEHRASMEGTGTRTPENLLRLSIGLEHPEDLIADLTQALS
jgi:cystathionine gamma-synthase